MRKKTILALLITAFLAFGTVPMSVSAQPPPRDRTLIIHVLQRNLDVTNFNTRVLAVPAGGNLASWEVLQEALFYANYENAEYMPWLAEGYEYNEDFTKVTIHIRKNVSWSDGVPFTGEDVHFSYNLLLDNAPTLSGSADAAAYIESVSLIDEYTVELTLKDANPRFHFLGLMNMFVPLPKHIWEGEDPLAFKFNPPVVTGPYIPLSDRVTESTIICERRDDWWATDVFGIRCAPEYVMFVYMPVEMEALMMSMAAHELDVPKITMSPPAFEDLRAKNPYLKDWLPDRPYAWLDPAPRYLGILWKYPYNIVEVRRAICYLVDREGLVEVALEGGSIPSWSNWVYYAANNYYLERVDDLLEKYPWVNTYDPDAAEEIFLGLGFTKGADGIWVTDNGTRLTLNIDFPVVLPEFQKGALYLADNLRDGGIDAAAVPLDYGTFFTRQSYGDYDAFFKWTVPYSAFDPYEVLRKHWSEVAPFIPIGEYAAHDFNAERWPGNATYDALVEEMSRTSPDDKEKMLELFRAALEIRFAEVPGGPVTNQAMIPVPRDHYYWTGFPSAENNYIHPPDWWGALYAIVVAGYRSPVTGEFTGGIKPASIDYATVYFTEDMPREYRSVDLLWYGPHKAGDGVRLPVDDAEYWIRKGMASYTSPSPAIAEIAELLEMTSSIKTAVEDTREAITGLSGQMSTIWVVAAAEGIAIVVLAVALMRKRT